MMKFGLWVCAAFLGTGLRAADIVITTNTTRTNLPMAPSAPRTNAFKGHQIQMGFRLELAAAEPIVNNPSAMAFDEEGRLFVVENPPGQPGRVRVLEDTAGNGNFESATVYADNLYSPTAITCSDGGIFVAASGQIIYLKDTKKDSVADVRRVVFSSFGDPTNGANGAVIITAIVRGVDNLFHVATAGRGGDIISSSAPKQSVVLSSGCFSFDSRTLALTPETGSAPAGMAFDSRGRRFVAGPGGDVDLVMYESRYAGRNPLFRMPAPLLETGVRTQVYPTGGQPPQMLAPSGFTFYRGYLFPPEYVDNPFVLDAPANLLHRAKLRSRGLELTAESSSGGPKSEFLTVSDNSFQPVALAGGPEGALYVAGPAGEPAVIVRPGKPGLDGKGPPGFGRIYRIVPWNFKQPPLARLGNAAVTNLVNSLRHSDAWHRESAARLIYERQDRAAIVPLINLLYDTRAPALGRLYALHALDGLQTLVPGHLVRALNDPDDRVREHAVLLSERVITNGQMVPDLVWGPLAEKAADPSPQVRYQLAFTLGQCRNPRRIQALADILRADAGDRWMRSAVFSSINDGAAEMFGILAGDGNFRQSASGDDILGRLCLVIGSKNQPQEIAQSMRIIAGIPDPETAFRAARKLGDGLQWAGSSLTAADPQGILMPLYATAARSAMDLNAAESARMEGMRLVDAANTWDGQFSVILINQWPVLSPRLKAELAVGLSARADRAVSWLLSFQIRGIPVSDISAFQIKFFLAQANTDLRRVALNLFGNPALVSRQNVVDQFAAAARIAGVSDRGRVIFLARCAQCHEAGNDGNPSGLSLNGAANLSRENLLAKIVDPNRDVTDIHSADLITTSDGGTLAGNVIAQDSHSLTLCLPNGETRVVARHLVVSQAPLGISTMPVGLEAGLNIQDTADLLEYLTSAGAPR